MMLYAIKDFHLEGIPAEIIDKWYKIVESDSMQINFFKLSRLISELCGHVSKPIVLMIDEVDQSSNSDVFMKFLGMLRNDYQRRTTVPVFQSVILTGVYDIKNLKLKIRKDTEHQYNSPWNIAADFNVDMSFSAADIAGMMKDYEADWNTGMDIEKISSLIYDYTQGYPFFVSRICKLLDEQIAGSREFPDKAFAWTEQGVVLAIHELLNESNTLFDDMVKKLSEFPGLKQMIKEILFSGRSFPYNADNQIIDIGSRFGFIKNENKTVMITNRIFETRMYDMFLSEEMTSENNRKEYFYKTDLADKNQFLQNGYLNMDLVMKKFMECYTEIYSQNDKAFLEENGRKLFLLFLKPIINGTGNYYIEARTRDMTRTDVIVDYKGVQYVIEMKIWHGSEYNRRGEKQLKDYLEYYHLTKGYLLSFNFNKNKVPQIKEILIENKKILETVV